MNPRAPDARSRPSDFLLLARCRARQLRNVLDQHVRETPWRSAAVLVLLVMIWVALYELLRIVFAAVGRWGLVAIIADIHIFVHFFLVLTVMLIFSNAILTFSTLYGRSEAAHLLSMPVRARQVVCAKWLEGMFLSSWSFLLLGVPLMLAMSRNANVDWYYYPLFLGHFLGFVAIPASVGLLAACAVALWAPRRPLSIAILAGGVVLALAVAWLVSISRTADESEEWLRLLLGKLALARQPILPSTWTARGIVAAVERDPLESLFYLCVVLGNAAFISWLTVNVLARTWPEAYSRAAQGRSGSAIRSGWITAALAWPFRLVLPLRLQRVMLKDLRHFARDAKQWTQMIIMFGLLIIYVLNLQRLPIDLNHPGTKSLMTFLNLTTVSLILATFTSRFVFPLLSVESQQLWLLELLPLRRTTLLLVKFLFALVLTSLSALFVMGLAVQRLGLPPLWAAINLVICLSICVGLTGLAVGLGARFPVLTERNPARIAAGFGGTFNLVASMLFVTLEMAGVAALSLTEMRAGEFVSLPDRLTAEGWYILAGLAVLGFVVGAGVLAVGAHHFKRLET